jgi:hypothetical protein
MSYFLLAPGGHTLPLNTQSMVVGSDAGADLPIPAEFELAGRHFLLQQTEEGYGVELLEPTSILAINGLPVRKSKLTPGDVIHAGKLELTYSTDVSLQVQAPEPPPDVTPSSSYRMPMPPDLPEISADPVAEMSTAALAMPPPIPQPPDLPAVDAAPEKSEAPRGIYRIPTVKEEPAEKTQAESNGLAGVEAKKGLGSVHKIADAEQWRKQHLSELESQQDLPQGLFMGLLVGIAIAVPFAYVADIPLLNILSGKLRLMVFWALFGGMGFLVGKAVRKFGHGMTSKFDYASAVCALLVALLTEYLRVEMFHGEILDEAGSVLEDIASELPTQPEYSHLYAVKSLIIYAAAMVGAFKASAQWKLKPKK